MANLAEIGKLVRDGSIDGFQARAMIQIAIEEAGHVGDISDRRFQMFMYRWGVHHGSIADSRSGIWVMVQCERKLWRRHGFNIPAAIIGEGC